MTRWIETAVTDMTLEPADINLLTLASELQESVWYLLVLASISVTFLLLSVSACFLESEKVTIILFPSFCFVLMKLYSVNM